MKNKGFTLVELLGVIVILALLMILVFPSIVNSVRNSSNKTDQLTLDLIYHASDLYISDHINNFPKINGSKYSIELKNLVDEGLLISPIKLSDSDITNSKCIQVTYNDSYKYELKDSGTCETSTVCILDDKDNDNKASLSDIVTCGTESFYVMYNENDEITMLSMYNLNIGDNAYPWGIKGIQNKNADGDIYGQVAFSESNYWVDENKTLLQKYGTIYPAYILDENSNLYQYVSSYELYLKNIGITSASANLMNYTQITNLGCIENNLTCSVDHGFGELENPAPFWVYSTNYYLGIAQDDDDIFIVTSHSDFTVVGNEAEYGVRPVITISTSEIN